MQEDRNRMMSEELGLNSESTFVNCVQYVSGFVSKLLWESSEKTDFKVLPKLHVM